MKMEKQNLCSKSATPLISMHKNSQTISKSKPKIRIIHIFAPEIIKIDAANFRELVQRLTGKPTDDDDDDGGDDDRSKKTSSSRRISRKKEQKILFSSSSKRQKLFDDDEFRERIKGEREIWSGANSGGGFLDQFEYGFIEEEINDHFPFLEGTTHHDHYQMDGESLQFACSQL